MRTIFILLGTMAAILAVIMAFLPFGSIALAPALLGLIFGFFALKMGKDKGKGSAKFIIVLSVLAGAIAVVKPLVFKNEVRTDQQFEIREQESRQEAIEELEELENELDELESITDSIQ